MGLTQDQFYSLSDNEQADWIARWEIEQEDCRQCGSKREDCANPEHEWYPQRTVDYARMAQAAAQWFYDEKHEDEPFHDGTFTLWSKRRTAAFPFHYMDGVSIWVSRLDLTPDDDFI